jgi:hypothetical protein
MATTTSLAAKIKTVGVVMAKKKRNLTLDDRQTSRLLESVQFSRNRMQPFREQRLAAVRAYVGSNYGELGASEKVPLNLMQMAVNIYRRQVAARAPQALIVARDQSLAPTAADFELALNWLIKEINLESSISRWVIDAMFSIGVMKVGISPGNQSDIEGYVHDSGLPFADVVDFDDFVFDMNAKSWDLCQYVGNRYTLPYEAAKEMKIFGDQEITPSLITDYNDGGDEKVSILQTGGSWNPERGYMEVVELWDLWLPYDNLLVTVQVLDQNGINGGKVLRVMEWDGPESGPYHILSFGDVPGNLMPLPPAQAMLDLHDASNRVFRKIMRQADRQKTVTIVSSGAEEDGRRLIQSNDGDTIRADNPQATREARYGGADPASIAFLLQLKDLFVYLGGNLDALGGLGRQANTVGQESLIQRSANMLIADMQDRTTTAVKSVIESLADYLWNDPVMVPKVVKTVTGTDFTIPVEFSQDIREGDLLDYMVEIAPYSMQSRTPTERLQTISQMMTQFIIPMTPQLQQRGISVNMDEFMKLMAQYSNLPEIERMLERIPPEEMQAMQQAAGGGGGDRPLQSPVTSRTTVRENVSGATRQGNDQESMRNLMAMANQGQPQ